MYLMFVSTRCRVEGLKAIYTSNQYNAYFAFVNEVDKNAANERVPQKFLSDLNLIQCEGDKQASLDEKFVVSYQAKFGIPVISNERLIQHVVQFMATKIPERRVPILQSY